MAAAAIVLASGASADSELPQGFVFAGDWAPLRAHTTYGASTFPIGIRVTVPTGGWLGAQWKANAFAPDEIRQRHLTCSTNPKVCAPPYFGWVTIGKPPATPAADPRGLIIILSSFSTTPSVSATVDHLCHDRAVTCEARTPVTRGGVHGLQFDGQTHGAGDHYLIAFTPPSSYAGKAAGSSDGDAILISGEHPFRVTILDVRGKTVVILVGTLVLPPDEFRMFVAKSDQLLSSLRFPS